MIANRFSSYDMLITIIGLLSYILDTISDIFLIIVFYLEEHYIWGSISLAFLALSSVSMLLFSFRWHITDRTLTCKNFLPHIVFLAPLHRYIEVIRLGYVSRKTKKKDDLDAVLRANVDVTLLRLIEAFTESAPQLVLQLYIMLKFSHYNWLIVVSTVLSLSSVAFSLTAYSDALRMAYKENYRRSWVGIFVVTTWQSWMLLARVTSMVVFSLVFQAWIFLAMGIHWILMTFWITMQNAEFGDTVCEKRMFNTISGFIYIFCFLNLKEGHARNRMAAFYCFILAENSLLMLLWYIYHPENTPVWLKATSLSVVFGGFVLGAALMGCYYCCCHPTSKTAREKKDLTAYWFKRANSLPKRNREPIINDHLSAARVVDWLNASVSLSTDMDSKYLSMDQGSLDLSLPDILKNGNFFDKSNASNSSRNMNDTRKCSGRQSKHSRKNEDWNGTVNSAKSSYLSASSSRPLINYSPSLVSYISNSRDVFSFTNEVILDRERSASVNSIQSSERAFAITGQNAIGEVNTRQNTSEQLNTSAFKEDSFYDSPEYKASNLSPLDPKKLWDESQSRLNNTASQIIKIVTRTNLKRRISESEVTWTKIDPNLREHQENIYHENVDYGQKSVTGRKSFEQTSFVESKPQTQYPSHINSALTSDSEDIGLSISDDDILESSNKENVCPRDESSLLTSYTQQTSRDYTSANESRSRLSNFFGDISSFHVTSPEVGEYYTSSASSSKLQVVEEESDEYNNSLRCWSQRMLARINKELENEGSVLNTSDTTPSLTSSYVQEENTCSTGGIEYRYSNSSLNSTENRSQQLTKSLLDSSSSYARESSDLRSYSRNTTSDIGGTSGSDRSYKNRCSSNTDKSTDDSGYSVAKSQSLKCLNNEKVQNSLTFVTKLDSDSDLGMRLGSDNDFREMNRRNWHVESIGNYSKTSEMRAAKSLPGLSYLCGDSDTSAWLSDESTVNKKTSILSTASTLMNHDSSVRKENITLTKDSEASKSVRFEDQTPVKTPQINSMTPVKVGMLQQSPLRPGKMIREDLTPVKVEKFSHSPLRPGKSSMKNLSLVKGEKFSHLPQQDTSDTRNSSLDITDFDNSPHRLGRSIDLFDRERYRNSIAESEVDSNVFTEPPNMMIRELKDSPYKFRSKENMGFEDGEENKHQKQIPIHRRQSSIYEQGTSDVRNKKVLRSSSKSQNINKTYDIENDENFTHIKPRTIVDDFKKKHTSRNTQKKIPAYSNDLSLYQSEAMTNPCYSYSDTESEADISRRSHIGHNKHGRVHSHSSDFRTPVASGEGKREVLKRLDNTPGFSPILTPDDIEALQTSNSNRNVVKPIVSTPKINPALYKSGLRFIDDGPCTIEI